MITCVLFSISKSKVSNNPYKTKAITLAPDFIILFVNFSRQNQIRNKWKPIKETMRNKVKLCRAFTWAGSRREKGGQSMQLALNPVSVHRAILSLSGRRVQCFTTGSPKWRESKHICSLIAKHLMPHCQQVHLCWIYNWTRYKLVPLPS